MTVLQASKENGRWAHLNTRRNALGPYWHRALAAVTRTGSFRLIYQKLDTTWSVAEVDLKSLLSTGSLITHAAMAPTQGWLFLHVIARRQGLKRTHQKINFSLLPRPLTGRCLYTSSKYPGL